MKADMAMAGITYAGITAATLPAAGWPGKAKAGYETISNAILTENGGFMLAEDGGRILTEQTTRTLKHTENGRQENKRV